MHGGAAAKESFLRSDAARRLIYLHQTIGA